ncbi:hypothetical protein [Haloechinothrix sp. LS1_15]|uniref:hypothetical protein n=1 Tax=Haloechinothrix sp. LS1_15 TaxID=2652248 RepID=UPI0029469CE5|nr:hypothetical protein [Haloechinothrix sp. LS1_15]MDV6012707.1 hypothetical protein [Haloechinothrix sp. LS1_15]
MSDGKAGASDRAVRQATRSGPGRVLITVYAIFAIGATSRSAVQIATRFEEAPLAYLLSAFAAVVYVLATIALARGGLTSRTMATVFCLIELLGVLIVGTASLLVPQAFPDATVWSHFGRGYLYIPLVLPVLGLWWLRRTAPRTGTGA